MACRDPCCQQRCHTALSAALHGVHQPPAVVWFKNCRAARKTLIAPKEACTPRHLCGIHQSRPKTTYSVQQMLSFFLNRFPLPRQRKKAKEEGASWAGQCTCVYKQSCRGFVLFNPAKCVSALWVPCEP